MDVVSELDLGVATKGYFKNLAFLKFLNGAEVDEVDEPDFSGLVVIFELPAYPEPKSLTPSELRALYAQYKSFYRVAEVIGASEGFAR